MSSGNLIQAAWREAFERRLHNLIGIGGIAVGLAVLAVSPAGFDGTDILALLALAIGVGAFANLLLNRTNPVPVLVVIVILVGTTSPFVDLATAMALGGVVIAAQRCDERDVATSVTLCSVDASTFG